MRKFWLVFWYEYRYHVFRWRFLGTLLWPLLAGLLFLALMAVIVWSMDYRSPVGIVDQAGFFDSGLPQAASLPIPGLDAQFQLFPSAGAARAALVANQIKVYYVFPPDFAQQRQVDVFYTRKPESTLRVQVERLVRRQYLRAFPPERANLLVSGPSLIWQSLPSGSADDAGSSLPEGVNGVARMVIPVAVIFCIYGGLSNSTGYLSRAIADEKANRTIEILVTSVSPEQLMTGKIIALVSVGLTQLLFWFSLPGIAAVIAVVAGLHLDRLYPGGLGALAALVAMTLPSLLLYAALIVMITVSFGDPREGQQFTSVVYFLSLGPLFLVTIFMTSPDGVIPLVLSFLPFSAQTALLMRSAFTTVPPWQIAAGWGSLLLGTAAAFWLAGRVFRATMMRFGKPVLGKAVLARLWKRLFRGGWAADRRAPARGEP